MAYDLLSETTPRVVFIGSSTRGPFTFSDSGTPIRVRDASFLVVKRYSSTTDEVGELLTLNTDFTANVTDADAVTITLTTAQAVLASTERLVVERTQPVVGVIEYSTGGNFAGPALADAISVHSEQIQELRRDIDRSIRAHNLDSTVSTFPLKANATSGDLLAFDDDKNLTAVTPSDIGITSVNLGTGWGTVLALPAAGTLDNLAGVRFVSTYAALTALVTATGLSDGSVYFTRARSTADDGGAGFWRYDSASTATANGGTILAVDGGGAGRFFRLCTLPADVRWFGVKCDGATDDASALSTALNTTAIPWFLIPADTRINTAVTISRDNVRISGPIEQGARILLGAATIDGLVVGDGSASRDRVIIEHLGFAAATSITKTAGTAVRIRKSTNCALRHFVITGQFTAASLEATTVSYIEYGRIYDSKSGTGTGILINGAGNDQNINEVTMDNVAASEPAYGLKVEETGALHVTDCDFLRCGYGAYIVPSAAKTVENVWLENNTWDTSSVTGLALDAPATATLRRVWIDGDWVATSNEHNVTIGGGGGTIDGIDWDGGAVINGGKHGVLYTAGTNVRLRGLLVSGNSQDSSGTYHGIAAASAGEFTFENIRSGQFIGFSNTQGYGIAITNAAAGNFSVIGGDLRTNVTGALSNAAGSNGSTKLVRDVLGYVTENRGTVSTTTTGAGQLTFNPGMSLTPTQIFIQAVSTNFVGAQILSSSSSSITIACLDYAGAAVASASVILYWETHAS